jgi:hypothetical protein
MTSYPLLQRSDSNMMIQWVLLPAPTQPGQVGGHEGVGKIVKLGPGTESSGLKIGDRVGIKWVSSACGNCRKLILFQPNSRRKTNSHPTSPLPIRHRWSMLQPKSIRLLYPRHIPTIRPGTRKLCNTNPRRPRLSRSSPNALRRRNSLLSSQTQQRPPRPMGRDFRGRRWPRSPGSATSK